MNRAMKLKYQEEVERDLIAEYLTLTPFATDSDIRVILQISEYAAYHKLAKLREMKPAYEFYPNFMCKKTDLEANRRICSLCIHRRPGDGSYVHCAMANGAPMMLALPVRVLSLNTLLRAHWGRRKKYTDTIIRFMKAALVPHRSIISYYSHYPLCVEITRIGKKQMDPDNLVGACKPIIDSLVRCGVLKDDNPDWLDLTVKQEVDKDKPYLVLLKIARK